MSFMSCFETFDGLSLFLYIKEFTDQFGVLLPKEMSAPQKDIANLLMRMGLPDSTFQIGRTKVPLIFTDLTLVISNCDSVFHKQEAICLYRCS